MTEGNFVYCCVFQTNSWARSVFQTSAQNFTTFNEKLSVLREA